MEEVKLSQGAIEFLDRLKGHEFFEFLNIEFLEVSEKKALGRIKMEKRFLNHYGIMHGGCLYSLADTVAGTMVCSSGCLCTTVDGHLNYFEPAMGTEYIYCEADLVRSGKHLANARIQIKDDEGKVLDDGTFNFFKFDKESLKRKLDNV